MENITTTATVVSSEPGYSLKTSTFSLAIAWIDYCDHSEQNDVKERLARELEQVILHSLPDGRGYSVLKGRENEIRQEANLLLLQRYLVGNPDLITATKKVDMSEIENQMRKSVNAAIWATSRTLEHSILKDRGKHEYCASIDDTPFGTCIHPAMRKTLWEIPFDAQRDLVFAALRMGIKEKLLPQKGAKMVMAMVQQDISQAKIARSHSISRQAIHQQIAPVRKYLREEIEKREFPTS